MVTTPPVCSYENSEYRTRFWEGQGREYEDLVERVALDRLLPRQGSTLIDIGAGFGRLANEYDGYDKVVLFDYSRSLLRDAQARLGNDPRFIFVAGNFYDMPFVDGLFDTVVQIRSVHHASDPHALFQQMRRINRPQGHYILEYANKMNLKAIIRFALRRQRWSPFAKDPVEFATLHYNFHPEWVREELQQSGFEVERSLPVSYFRISLLKRIIPTRWLVALDSLAQRTTKLGLLSPSVFLRNQAVSSGKTAAPGQFFACPSCSTPLEHEEGAPILHCTGCGLDWKHDQGLYDFKTPVSG